MRNSVSTCGLDMKETGATLSKGGSMGELQYTIRCNAGRWMLLKRDERGELHLVRNLTEREAQRLVGEIEGR